MTTSTDVSTAAPEGALPRSSEELRLLFVCGGSYVSGAELSQLSIMEGLQARGHTVRCITNSWNDGDFQARLMDAGIPYRPIAVGAIGKSLRPKYLWWTVNALAHLPKAYVDFWREQRRFQPDLVIFSGSRTLSTLRPLLDLDRCVLHVRSMSPASLHFRRAIGGYWSTGSHERCRAYIAISRFIRGRLIDQGVPECRVHLVMNGVEVPGSNVDVASAVASGTSDVCKKPEAGRPPVSIGIVGQVGEWKGHDDLIEALNILANQDRRFMCKIVGRGEKSYVRKLKKKASRLGVDGNLQWMGFVKNINAIYSAMDVVVVPSRFEEPFGRVAAEAGMHALPVVATRRGGLPEIVVDGETGFIVDAEAPAQIAERLERLADDAALRRRMGKAARQHVEERFTTERMIDDIESILLRIS